MDYVKKIIFLIFCLFILNNIYSQNLFEEDELEIEIEIEILYDLELQKKYEIKNLKISSIFSKENIQNFNILKSYEVDENNEIDEDNNLVIKPTEYFEKNSKKIKFVILNKRNFPKIKKEDSFLNSNLNKENKKYLEFDKLIITNNEITDLALKIIGNETDKYIISHKVANWVSKNIEYDLSTIDEIPNQNSMEILKSKRGVCQELTILYTSLMRSLKIPTKVSVGFAYSNSEEIFNLTKSKWSGHVWSEVLIGNSWVPFDLTYSQFGNLDPTHIKLLEGVGISEISTKIKGEFINSKIIKNSFEVNENFKILEQKKYEWKKNFGIDIEIQEELKPDSYGYLELKIFNFVDYYIPINLYFSKTNKIYFLNRKSIENILLTPKNDFVYYKHFKVDEFDEYSYYSPFEIFDNNIQINKKIIISDKGKVIDFENLPQNKIKEKEKIENFVEIYCFSNGNKQNKNCLIKNIVSFNIDNLKFCVKDICDTINLLFGETKKIEISNLKKEKYIEIYFRGEKKNIYYLLIKSQDLKIDYFVEDPSNIIFNYSIQNFSTRNKIEFILNKKDKKTFYDFSKNRIIFKSLEKNNEVIVKLYFLDFLIKEENIFIEIEFNFFLKLKLKIEKIFSELFD